MFACAHLRRWLYVQYIRVLLVLFGTQHLALIMAVETGIVRITMLLGFVTYLPFLPRMCYHACGAVDLSSTFQEHCMGIKQECFVVDNRNTQEEIVCGR